MTDDHAPPGTRPRGGRQLRAIVVGGGIAAAAALARRGIEGGCTNRRRGWQRWGRPPGAAGRHAPRRPAPSAGGPAAAGAVRTGHRCTGFRQDDEPAAVSFGDGVSDEADVVIGADGIHSVLQGNVAEPAAPVFSGVIAHRGVIPVPPAYPAGTMRMWLGEGKHFLAFPVRAGQLLNFVGPRRLSDAPA